MDKGKQIKTTYYKPFDTFVVRTPAFSIQKYQEYIKEINFGNIGNLVNDDYFLESIYIASASLYDEILRHKTNKLTEKEEEKLIISLVKYLTRMSWRCTPFGLFSGCTLGKITNENIFEINNSTEIKKYTRIDMNCLCKLIKKISEDETIKNELKYYPNNSIYCIGKKLRYVEITYRKNKRVHKISSVENSEYLTKIIENSENGQTINNLANQIVEVDVSFDEAKEYVIELIDNQLLENELTPSVTGNDLLLELIRKLEKINPDFPIIESLKKIQKILDDINSITKNKVGKYLEIIGILNEIGINDFKNYFQVDISKNLQKTTLNKEIVSNVWEAVTFLNKLTPKSENHNLQEFKNSYYKRYEGREMPLSIVLDNETGLGYPINQQTDSSELLELYNFGAIHNNSTLEWSNFQSVLHKKYLETISKQLFEIELKEADFQNIKEVNWNDLPLTISLNCKVLDNNDLVFLSSCGGSSAANLLGRFAHINKSIENYLLEITKKEEELQNDAIIAEIVHLPEDRIGNVIFRPTIRKYEIPYLAQSSVRKDFQLPISDLTICIKDNTIILYSNKINKRIIPRLSNAHNFLLSKIPLYRFLCDLQTENLRSGFGFRWSSINNKYDFLPRVKYKNVILSFARWLINTEDFKKLKIQSEIMKWRKDKQMPRYVVLPDGDNEFFVDLDCEISIKSLLDLVKKREQFYLQEFPFNVDTPIISDNQGNCYTNEFIINFYKDFK